MRLEDAVTDVLTRLGDKENAVWTRSEIELYYKDGLDLFCRRTKCLWDMYVIENLPPVANWQTDLEKYLAEQIPGFGLTEERMHMTAKDERGKQIGDAYAGTREGPVVATRPGDRSYFDNFSNLTVSAGKQVTGGTLPNDTVEVTRVAFDDRTLSGISSQRMREIDPNYETRSGDPQWYMFDKDGIFYLRVVPAAQGDASYDTVSGSWGTLTRREDSDGDIEDTVDGIGLLTPVNAQDETSYDSTTNQEGTFAGGTGHAALDVITLADGTTVTVDAVSSGVVTEFTIDSSASTGSTSYTIAQSSTTGSGVNFSLTMHSDNVTTEFNVFGILRHRTDMFPSGGPHGTPTRVHPYSKSIRVEVFRLNRDPDSHEIEVPLAYQKYPVFWAMHRALEKTGQGQDIQLSDHFKARFERGVGRMERKVRELDKERIGRMGGLRKMSPFGLGSPQPPYPYGIPF